jgi:hypothetical protein
MAPVDPTGGAAPSPAGRAVGVATPGDLASPIEGGAERLGTAAVIGVGAALAALCAAALVVRSRIYFTVGFEDAGSDIANPGLAIQLAAMVAGVVAIQLASPPRARAILIAEGAVCLLAHGELGLVYAAALVAWYGVLAARWLGRARAPIAVVGLAAMNACGFAGGAVPAEARVFSMMFALRLMLYAWDRWQNDFERPPLLDYLAYMLPAPLVIVPPYLLIIPVFSEAGARFRPGLTAPGVRRIARHVGLAIAFGALRGAAEATGFAPSGVPWLYWNLVCSVLAAAAYAHLFIALLLLHGIDERMPLDRPLLARRFAAYWGRYQVHQKDAQVLMFFTPAMLRMRRWNRYLAISIAVTWTMIVGNTVLHIASRYCFLPAPWPRIRWVLITNVVMSAALAIELCLAERRARRPGAPPDRPGLLGWAITMTLAAIAST